MSTLPHLENAVINETKLKEYCLNEHHPTGKHKARLFKLYLGLSSKDALLLKNLILDDLAKGIATEGKEDEYGKRFTVELRIRNFDKIATLISGWIILKDENFPRLITCYLKK